MNNIIEDLSKLTTIPVKSLNKLVDKTVFCISDIVEDAVLEQKKLLEIDIGIGILHIKLESESVKYKFIPHQILETAVKDTIVNKRNLLQDTLEKVLVNRVVNTYKELL